LGGFILSFLAGDVCEPSTDCSAQTTSALHNPRAIQGLGLMAKSLGWIRHARGQHSQRVAKINHLIQAAAEEIGRVTHQTQLHKPPRKRCVPGVKLGEIIVPNSKKSI